MPIKIFSAPGDHQNDFRAVEEQVNQWLAESRPRLIGIHPMVNALDSSRRNIGDFMMTVVVHYEDGPR